MNQELFREKSLQKIQSPEDLNDYIRVSNPGVWLILAAVILLLIGACIWGIFGHLDTVVKTEAYVENGLAACMIEDTVPEEGMEIVIAGQEYTIEQVLTQGGSCIVTATTQLPDGVYPAEVKTESVTPFSLVFQ